ncbi:MAG: polysulfide reductase NrfD [Eggerthellaceae bacterium]|nr:polysulfide reductase NrfD [Eggerthellaceae bacterium]
MVEKAKQSRGLVVAGAIGAAVALVGIVFWFIQLSGGMVQTGMRNLDSWGLYITMFMFFVGLSAGGLIISSIPNAFGMKGFGGISKVAIWTSICCTVAAIGFVVVDMGQPLRVWELFVYSNMGSPLMWDIIVLMVYLILSVVYLVFYMRYEAGKTSHVAIRVISVVALVCAVLVHSVTAWIFGLQQGHEFWYTALLGPWFVSSALVCGTALVMVVCIALRKMGYLALDQAYIVKMAKMLAAFIAVDLYFFGCDLLTSAFPGGSGAEVVDMLVSGPLAPFFWFEVIGCAAAMVVCLVPALRRNGWLVAASVVAILGILCKRVQLLVGGFQLPNIPFANVEGPYAITFGGNGVDVAYSSLVYWPTGIEWIVTLGILGLAFALLCFGLAWLNLKPVAKEASVAAKAAPEAPAAA